MKKSQIEECLLKILMLSSLFLVIASLGFILTTVLVKGLPALNWAMLTQTPQGGYYLGKQGGILNAILGSLYLASGATLIALAISLPIVLSMQAYLRRSPWPHWIRLALDALWGVPSIIYGAFGFSLMLVLGLRASLLGGILALTLLELPIMARAMDEVVRMIPVELEQAALALGATRLETVLGVVIRQALPGIVTAILLAFGRGIGDAAAVLFTAGYSDRLPDSLLHPVASLPLAVFFQLGTPFPEVQQRAYAAALILTVVVLCFSLCARWLTARLGRYSIHS